MTSRFRFASAHGRFQPLHNEHMSYLATALGETDFLHIGITQFERSRLRQVPGAGAHRDDASSNPLTYFERSRLLQLALGQFNVSSSRYEIGPFPIEQPETLEEFLPADVQILSTRVDEWNDKKVELLRHAGYEVEYLFERDPRGISGAEIRALMARGDQAWQTMVPEATISYIIDIDLPGRLREFDR